MIDSITTNVKRMFATVLVGDGPISEKFLHVWSNYEHLSKLNRKTGILYGFPNFLAHASSFAMSCDVMIVVLKTDDMIEPFPQDFRRTVQSKCLALD